MNVISIVTYSTGFVQRHAVWNFKPERYVCIGCNLETLKPYFPYQRMQQIALDHNCKQC